jgi:hypothetical protein
MVVKGFKVYRCVLQIIQPPYSPDLAPIKTFVFSQVETSGRHGRQGECNRWITCCSCRRLSWRLCVTSRNEQKACCRQDRWLWRGGGETNVYSYKIKQQMYIILIRCTMYLLLFCTMTNKCTIISQIITLLLHISTLSCHPQWIRS